MSPASMEFAAAKVAGSGNDKILLTERGTMFGCGFSTIALGDGVIDIKGVCAVLKDANIASSTLEIVGSEDILKQSVVYLRENGL